MFTGRSSGLIGGFCLIAVGVAFSVGAFSHEFGTAARIGPGYFPLILGVLTTLFGVAVAFGGDPPEDEAVDNRLRPIAAVLSSILLFSLVVNPFGFLPAVFTSVAVAAAGDTTSRPLPTLFLSAAVTAAAWLIFVVGIGLPFDLYKVPV